MGILIKNTAVTCTCDVCDNTEHMQLRGHSDPLRTLEKFERNLERLGWLVLESYLCPICYDKIAAKAG